MYTHTHTPKSQCFFFLITFIYFPQVEGSHTCAISQLVGIGSLIHCQVGPEDQTQVARDGGNDL